jgi:hypothetical protein
VLTETANLIPIENAIKETDQDSLVIFDIDMVLIMPIPLVIMDPYCEQLWEKIVAKNTKEQVKFLESIVMVASPYTIVDLKINSILNYLKKQKIPTVGLTAISTGQFGVLAKLEDFRIKNLKNINIDFTKLNTINGTILAKELENTNMIFSDCTGIPLLKSGIIFTAGVNKAVVLEYIMHEKNYYPKTIIFVDDDLNNLKSLEKLCIKLNINFYGFYYTAVSLMPLPKIKKSFEKLRFKILEQEHCWLSYKEIAELKEQMKCKPYDY